MDDTSGEDYAPPASSSGRRAPKRAHPSASTSGGRVRGPRRPGPLDLGSDDMTRVTNLRQWRLDFEGVSHSKNVLH